MGAFGGGGLGDLGGGFSIASILSAIGGLISDVLNFLLGIIGELAQFVQDFISFLGKVFVKVGGFFKYIWDHGISKLFTSVAHLLQKAHQFLEARLAPVVKFLTRVRAIIDKYYKLYLKPYLQFIQKLRRYLLVLKLLHIKFAQKLDARLAQQEALITRVFLDIRGSLNTVLNLVQALTDPRKLSRWVLVSIAGRRVAAASVRAFTGLPIGHFFPSNAVGRFAFERPPLSAADYTNPRFNPPPSVIMAGLLSGPSLDGTIDPDPPDDAALDAAQPLDYYGDMMQALVAGESFYDDLDAEDLSITQTMEQRNGPLFDAGKLVADFAASLSAA